MKGIGHTGLPCLSSFLISSVFITREGVALGRLAPATPRSLGSSPGGREQASITTEGAIAGSKGTGDPGHRERGGQDSTSDSRLRTHPIHAITTDP